MKKAKDLSEDNLAKGLQPIRSFVLAQAIYNFMEIGIQELIVNSPGITLNKIAKTLELNEYRLNAFLQYLANENYLILYDDGRVVLTKKGMEISDYRPWYNLIIGGYSQTFQQISSAMKKDGYYADRNSTKVGIGSCGISQHDALPMTRKLLMKIPEELHTIIDLGCGDGSYLIDLCESMPHLQGIGLDIDVSSVQAANDTAKKNNISSRMYAQVGSYTDLIQLSSKQTPICYITAFVLQEILEQSGRKEIVDMMHTIIQRYPNSYWIVIEVDHRPKDKAVMETALGLAYYNPYYLIHSITEQRLESIEFWTYLFNEAGLRIVSMETPEPYYDSLGLKVGFLLKSN